MKTIKEIIDDLHPDHKKLLKENRDCFLPDDWSTLMQDQGYLLVMLALARTHSGVKNDK